MSDRLHLTKRRLAVTEILQKADQPLSAAQIAADLYSLMDQATVYRGLQFLEDNGVIESFIFECRKEGILKYYVYKRDAHSHYFHCELCHEFLAVERCDAKSICEIETEHRLTITSHTVCYRGICETCRNERIKTK